MWEQWNGSESRNHIMFGDISAWFYKALAGINLDPAAPAFKHFIIKPNIVGGLTSAEASYDSVRGQDRERLGNRERPTGTQGHHSPQHDRHGMGAGG